MSAQGMSFSRFVAVLAAGALFGFGLALQADRFAFRQSDELAALAGVNVDIGVTENDPGDIEQAARETRRVTAPGALAVGV